MTLSPHEFIHRFLMHVLPKGFHRIRHYGLFANGSRTANIARARELLGAVPCDIISSKSLDADALAAAPGKFALAEGRARHIAIDGKTLKGSRRLDTKALHVLSAFATELGTVTGDLKVKPHQSEITAAMVLLKGPAGG
jgi:hypothetical protein